MTSFLGDIEMMPSRKDGNCSRCSVSQCNMGKKARKAKWLVSMRNTGNGRVAMDGSPATPLTYEQYGVLMKTVSNDMEKMHELLNSKPARGVEVCGYCKNSLVWKPLYDSESGSEWCEKLP